MVYSRRIRHPGKIPLAEILAAPIPSRPESERAASIDAEHELSPVHQAMLEEFEHFLFLLEYMIPRSEALAVWMKDNLKFEKAPPAP